MRVKMHHQGMLLTGVTLALVAHAWAFPEYARQTKAACAACHVNPAGGVDLTPAGKVFKVEKKATEVQVVGANYVGINKCKMCHITEYKSWQGTPHAGALAVLKNAPDTSIAAMAARLKVELKGPASENDACVSCHVTGFHLTGGYPAADSAKTAAVANVTCEACHGPGSKHVAAAIADKKKTINRNVTANMCTQCHVSATSPTFSFVEFKKRGVHAVKASK
jgi:hypothetical protein